MEHFYFMVANSCRGLACFYGTTQRGSVYSDVAIVCNPITGEYATISAPPIPSRHFVEECDYCFGYSSVSNQYKILRTLREYDGREPSYRYVWWRSDMIYTLGTCGGTGGGNWKSIDYDQQFGCEFERAEGMYLNSVVHWIGWSCYESWQPAFEGSGSFIISFDFDKEEYGRFVVQPEDRSILDYGALTVLGGCLSISTTVSSREEKTMEIWMLRDKNCDSWTKELVIDLLPVPMAIPSDKNFRCVTVQSLKNGRELLL